MFNIFLPNIAEAAAPAIPQSVLDFMGNVYSYILNPIIALLFALATLYFIYGIVAYIWNPENTEMREKGRNAIIWGIIGIFIMTSVFGIMNLLINTIGADPTLMNYV